MCVYVLGHGGAGQRRLQRRRHSPDRGRQNGGRTEEDLWSRGGLGESRTEAQGRGADSDARARTAFEHDESGILDREVAHGTIECMHQFTYYFCAGWV